MNKIRWIRNQLGVTQAEFANAIGITKAALGHYENCRRNPKHEIAEEIKKIADARGIKVDLVEILLNKKNK